MTALRTEVLLLVWHKHLILVMIRDSENSLKLLFIVLPLPKVMMFQASSNHYIGSIKLTEYTYCTFLLCQSRNQLSQHDTKCRTL